MITKIGQSVTYTLHVSMIIGLTRAPRTVQTLDFLRFVSKIFFSPKSGDKSGYSGHRVICLVIMNPSCDSKRLFESQMNTFDSI